MEFNFDVNQIFQERLASGLGLDTYKIIMERVKKVDVSKDKEFQRIFNGFYLVRRDATWRELYYDLFESMKKQEPTFEEIITYLYKMTGNVEASFSSKMLATLCPEKPIWDRYVMQNLSLQLKGNTQEEKLTNAIALYSTIEKWYNEFLCSEKAEECIRTFDNILPDYAWISDAKKIDTIVWSIR